MFGFVLKTTLEVAAVILLLIGYLNEEKVVAFERALWKRIRSGKSARPVHSATYEASRKAQWEAQQKRERIALGAEYARAHAVVLRQEEEPRRVA